MGWIKDRRTKKVLNELSVEMLREAVAAKEEFNEQSAQLLEAAGVTIDADDDQWRKLTGDNKRDLSPMTQSRMQETALYLWQSNLLANRLIELPLAYLLAEGVKVKAEDELVQEWVDEFWDDPINSMDLKLPRKARELSIYGNQYWPAFVNEFNGHVRLGYLDPALVETVVVDPDNGEQPIGIVTVKDKKGHARRYRVIVNGAENDLFTQRTREIREKFTDGDLFFFNVNSLSNGTMGRSDLLGQIDWLDAYDQFMFGELDRSSFLRAFIWTVTMKNATPEEVAARAKEITTPSPGSTRVTNDSETWKAETPSLNAQDSSENARLFRNHIMGGGTIPEHWFGGGGDVNRATAGEMGDPTFKMMTMRQTYLGYILKTVLQYVIRKKELAVTGSEPKLTDPIYKISVQWPEMVTKDISKYASALQQTTSACAQLVNEGLLNHERALQVIEKITDRLGVPFDVTEELKKALEAMAEKKEADLFKDLPDDDKGGEVAA